MNLLSGRGEHSQGNCIKRRREAQINRKRRIGRSVQNYPCAVRMQRRIASWQRHVASLGGISATNHIN